MFVVDRAECKFAMKCHFLQLHNIRHVTVIFISSLANYSQALGNPRGLAQLCIYLFLFEK